MTAPAERKRKQIADASDRRRVLAALEQHLIPIPMPDEIVNAVVGALYPDRQASDRREIGRLLAPAFNRHALDLIEAANQDLAKRCEVPLLPHSQILAARRSLR